jgi:hypothetical protein
LSNAFQFINVDLLLKRMSIMDIPKDLTKKVTVWLRGRSTYVNVVRKESKLLVLEFGTVQGSNLGPVRFAIYLSSIFENEKMTALADDISIKGGGVAALVARPPTVPKVRGLNHRTN